MMETEEVLKMMIKKLLEYIEELKEYSNIYGEEFRYGERTAYTECLEMIQQWKEAKNKGLDFEIEQKYPL